MEDTEGRSGRRKGVRGSKVVYNTPTIGSEGRAKEIAIWVARITTATWDSHSGCHRERCRDPSQVIIVHTLTSTSSLSLNDTLKSLKPSSSTKQGEQAGESRGIESDIEFGFEASRLRDQQQTPLPLPFPRRLGRHQVITLDATHQHVLSPLLALYQLQS